MDTTTLSCEQYMFACFLNSRLQLWHLLFCFLYYLAYSAISIYYLAYSAIPSKITLHLIRMFVFLCCCPIMSEIMNQQILPDKLVETNDTLQSDLKANIFIFPNLLSNQEEKNPNSIQKAMIYTILNSTLLLYMKPLSFIMSVRPKYQIDVTKSKIFPIKRKNNYFYLIPSLIWRWYEQ